MEVTFKVSRRDPSASLGMTVFLAHHKLGIGSELLSTARLIEFRQRSCISAVGQLRFSSLTVMRTSSAITLPICACGIFFDFSSNKTRSVFFGSQEITMRDCASLKRIVDAGVSPAEPPQFSKPISAPSNPSGLKQHSASATASPPSLQSCALLTSPSRIKSRTPFCTAISSLRSSFGPGPTFFPKQTLRKREPPRL